ncbi:MAG: DUF2520 domain-containing protein [Clostridiales bacterium]|nr:DUF2520 domain-containing protein [Clostridiales bacterium]
MKIGWIGAGKVGCSLGRYFVTHGLCVSGYYSRSPKSAAEAARITGTKAYFSMEELMRDSDAIFLTVPDGAIASVWEQLKNLQIRNRIICHCSGVLSSTIFSDIAAYKCSGYSIHPLLAISSKQVPEEEISKALFTIEGSVNLRDAYAGAADDQTQKQLALLLEACGNRVIYMDAKDKPRYHAAAVMASNLVIALAETAKEELMQCGFTSEDAIAALAPFMQANVAHLTSQSIEEALTGPVERGDVGTVQMHLDTLEGDNREIYRELSQKALAIAKRKHPERNYDNVQAILGKC